MVDISPELSELINTEFRERLIANHNIKSFMKKLEAETATGEDVSIYASELGKIASETFVSVLTEDRLPNGRMYYNIAEKTIKPLLKDIFDMVMKAAKTQQEYEDRKNGIGMKATIPEFPEKRINGLMFKLSEFFDEETYNV